MVDVHTGCEENYTLETLLITKENRYHDDVSRFANIKENITAQGRLYLGVAITNQDYVEHSIQSRVQQLGIIP